MIKSRLLKCDNNTGMTIEKINRRFSGIISNGENHTAISLITEHGKGGVLEVTPEVLEVLKEKHPRYNLLIRKCCCPVSHL